MNPGAATRELNGAPRPIPLEPPELGDDYDAIRDLFLSGPLAPAIAPPPTPESPAVATPPPAASTPIAAAPCAPQIEGLILGHLPVFAPAWVRQYARFLAEEGGAPVGLIHLREGRAAVEVFAPADPEADECGTLEEAVAAARAGRWLFRVDDLTEPHLAESARPGRITLLTGADDLALAACYRALKGLVREAADGIRRGPPIRIAIVGAPAERAAAAAERIGRASRAHLGREIELVWCAEKIAPGRSALLFSGLCSLGLDAVLDAVAAAGMHPRDHGNAAGPGPRARTALQERIGAVADAPGPAEGPFTRHGGSGPVSGSTDPAPIEAGAADAALWSLLPGLRPLAAWCPHAPGVELAVDEAGTLHLLARAEDGAEPAALSLLETARAWAGPHLPLIALTAPDAGLRAGADPVVHLATTRAAAVRGLLDSGVRVHLLVPVAFDGTEKWVCVGLN